MSPQVPTILIVLVCKHVLVPTTDQALEYTHTHTPPHTDIWTAFWSAYTAARSSRTPRSFSQRSSAKQGISIWG